MFVFIDCNKKWRLVGVLTIELGSKGVDVFIFLTITLSSRSVVQNVNLYMLRSQTIVPRFFQ